MEVWGGNEPFDSAVAMSGLDAWLYCRPYRSAEAGGDVYYLSSCATGRITRLLVADVSGHGDQVSAIGATLRQLMYKNVNHLDQTRFVSAMNREFVDRATAGVFATAVVSTFFSTNNRLMLCNAGHPPPLWYSARRGTWRLIEGEGNIPLGVIEGTEFRQFAVRLEQGDLVLCYTDSLIESLGADGEMLGVEGLSREIAATEAAPPDRFIASLLRRIASLHPGNLEADDVTVMLFSPRQTPLPQRLLNSFLAPWRVLGGVIGRLFGRGAPIPWPQWSIANIGGAIFEPLGRLWGRRM